MKDKNALLRYFTVDLVIWALCMVMACTFLVLYLAAYGLLITDEVKASKINQPRFRMASLAVSFMLVSFVEKLINMI